MDNGSLLVALFAFPFWAGIVLASLLFILLIPIGVNVVIRIMIDAIVEHRGGPRRRGSAPTAPPRGPSRRTAPDRHRAAA